MDIENLETFIEVAETRSFSQSAKILSLTQPAVSKRIASLESALSTRLFDRVGRTVHLTEAGRILLPSAKQSVYAISDQVCNDQIASVFLFGHTVLACANSRLAMIPALDLTGHIRNGTVKSGVQGLLQRFNKHLSGSRQTEVLSIDQRYRVLQLEAVDIKCCESIVNLKLWQAGPPQAHRCH